MCKCRPMVKTPYCGKGDCVWPDLKIEGEREIAVCRTPGCKHSAHALEENGETFFGYTFRQIRQMDIWFRSNNLSWQILNEKYKEGFEAGVTADREIINSHLKALMESIEEKK